MTSRPLPVSSLRTLLGARALVMVGMMGAGKTTVGRRLARKLDLPFIDADTEIETAAGMPVSDIFALYGEQAFRDGEVKVIARLLDNGPQVLATGGGAFLNPATRARVKSSGVSIWLKADPPVLLKRVQRKGNRPLLHTKDPEATLRRLLEERRAAYEEADLCVPSHDSSHSTVVNLVLEQLSRYFDAKSHD